MAELSDLPPERLSDLLGHADALLEEDALTPGLRRELDTFRADILGYLSLPARPALWPKEPPRPLTDSDYELLRRVRDGLNRLDLTSQPTDCHWPHCKITRPNGQTFCDEGRKLYRLKNMPVCRAASHCRTNSRIAGHHTTGCIARTWDTSKTGVTHEWA